MCLVRVRFKVWLRTEEYLKDALGSVVTDIEDLAINLLAFVNAQVRRLFFYSCICIELDGAII